MLTEIILFGFQATILPVVAASHRVITDRIYLTSEQINTILKGCKKNERLAQKKLYRTYYSYTMSIASRYSSCHDNAIEMINDAFLKIFKDIQNFEPRYENTIASFTAWIKKITICSCIDHLRKYNKKEEVTAINPESIIFADKAETGQQVLQHKEIIKCIQQLSPAYKAVFNLNVIEGFSHCEIAERLHISEGASKSNLHKAKQNLRQLLTKQNSEEYAASAK